MHGSYILATKNRGLKTQLYALFIYLFIWFLSKLCAYLKQHKGSTNRPSLGKFQQPWIILPKRSVIYLLIQKKKVSHEKKRHLQLNLWPGYFFSNLDFLPSCGPAGYWSKETNQMYIRLVYVIHDIYA
jgi:hypothetical protein